MTVPPRQGNLKRFSIVVTTDQNLGTSKGGKCPWSSKDDAEIFRKITLTGTHRNAIIVGRVSFERIFEEKPFSKRDTIVISKSYKQENHPGIIVCHSFKEALTVCANNNYGEVFIGGGDSVFKEITSRWMHLCNSIYWTQYKLDYKCDTIFEESLLDKDLPGGKEASRLQSMTKYHLRPSIIHKEFELLDLLEHLVAHGGSLSEKHVFGVCFEFSLLKTFPLLTTNAVDAKGVFSLFLMALKGHTDIEIVRDMEVNGIYESLRELTSFVSQEKKDSGLEEGDMGPWWGWLTRHRGLLYSGKQENYESKGTDQLMKCISDIKATRYGRMILFDPRQDQYSSISNRYSTMEFINSPDRVHLDLIIHVSSMEAVEDLKIDVAMCGLYLVAMSLFVGAKPRILKFLVSDFWARRAEPVEKQLLRTPLPFPILLVRNASSIRHPDDLSMDSWILKFHESWGHIAPVKEDQIIRK